MIRRLFFKFLGSFESKSASILSSFSKTRNELTQLNVKIEADIKKAEIKVTKLNEKKEKMSQLHTQHTAVVSNIDTFLNAR